MRWGVRILLCLGLVVLSATAQEPTRIAVLDFELNDLTLQPGTPQERERTASVAPLLRTALAERGYTVVPIPSAVQAEADKSFGYLFERPAVVAELGQQFDADYVAVGRVHKPSFLFAYLKVELIDTARARRIGEFIVEVKGNALKLTEKGVANLAEQIDLGLRATPPATSPAGQ